MAFWARLIAVLFAASACSGASHRTALATPRPVAAPAPAGDAPSWQPAVEVVLMFDPGAAELDSAQRHALELVAAALRAQPEIGLLAIDAQPGSPADEPARAQRAQNARAYLMARGLSPDRLRLAAPPRIERRSGDR